MKYHIHAITTLFILSFFAFSENEIETDIKDIYYRGSCEEASALTFRVDVNEYASASRDKPFYIRVRLTHNARICQSLVGNTGDLIFNEASDTWEYDPDAMYSPVFLAMRLENPRVLPNGQLDKIIAPPETVSIVRWLKDETDFWIRIQSSSSTWIYNALTQSSEPPSPEEGLRVVWSLGETARSSHTANKLLYTINQANLPGNTRSAVWMDETQTHWAVSTLLCVDMTGSNLQAAPLSDSILMFGSLAFKETSQGWDDMDYDGEVSNDLHPQFSLKYSPINGPLNNGYNPGFGHFSGEDTIARGIDIKCSGGLIPTETNLPASKRLCQVAWGNEDTDRGLVCMENEVLIRFDCGPDAQKNSLFTPSCVLANLSNSRWGFALHSSSLPEPYDHFTDGTPIYKETPTNSGNPPFPSRGSYFMNQQFGSSNYLWDVSQRGSFFLGSVNHVVLLNENMAENSTGASTMLLHTEVSQYQGDPPGAVNIHVGTFLSSSEFQQDKEPYPGDEQCKACSGSTTHVSDNMWYFGDFLPCLGDPISLRFAYIPKLMESPFWVGIAISNNGSDDFKADGDLTAILYEADGSRWKAVFPALPVGNMQTWLFMEGYQGVGFYGSSSNPLTEDLFIKPISLDNDLILGETQMSMVVTGEVATTKAHLTEGGSLNGYALIGRDIVVETSYLAKRETRFERTKTTTPQNQSIPDHESFTPYVNQIMNMIRKNINHKDNKVIHP